MLYIISLSILIVLCGAHLLVRSFFVKKIRLIAIAVYSLILISLFIKSRQLYLIWADAKIAKYLLPPHTPITYFAQYALTHIYAPYLLSALLALVLYALIMLTPASRRTLWFEHEEPVLIAIAISLLAYPLSLVYITISIFLYALYALINGRASRVSFSLWWLPLAIMIQMASPLLLSTVFVQALSFTSPF